MAVTEISRHWNIQEIEWHIQRTKAEITSYQNHLEALENLLNIKKVEQEERIARSK
jgi:hypothetical protein